MKSKIINDLLELKYGFKDSYSNEELESIESITINRFDVDGALLFFDFNELLYLNGLKELVIENYNIDEDIVNIISNLNIKSLSLYNCEFVDDPSIVFGNELNSLVIDGTYIDLSLISNNFFEYLYIANMSIDESAVLNSNNLDISRALVSNLYFIRNSNINKIIVSEKQYENNKIILTNIPLVVIMEDNGQFVKQEVNNNG